MMKNPIVLIAVIILALVAGCSSKLEKETAAVPDYREDRINRFPVAMQCWSFRKFTFFETLEKTKELGIQYLQAYSSQPLGGEYPDVKFSHELPDSLLKVVRERLKAAGLSVISYGVVRFENNEAAMRRVFDFAKKMRIRTIVTEPEYDDFSLIEKMVDEYDIRIAVHNHPEPSKYARPESVLERIRGRDPRMGACADIGHWMRTGVNPIRALRLLKGRILDVHLKDLNVFGDKEAHDVPYGRGKANIHDVLAELSLQGFGGALVVEYENKLEADNPVPSIKKGLEYIDSITYYRRHEKLLKWDRGAFNKHGWNHYGPGYFELDDLTGILTSRGGMGLFWFGEKMYGDFVLELDYKCSQNTTNSGVFLRVPDIPVSNDYIYHSFEIQINDAAEGIHKTAAVYDANAPSSDAFFPAGQWNHFKITFQGDNIQVELNGKKVNDWKAKPAGKVEDFSAKGYIGLQNHDHRSPVYFKNIYIRELE
jgi:sugar phosphate isomerase/epimerase